jgi:ubiquinone/menaquinone biosynthesis C-methylase UbiE
MTFGQGNRRRNTWAIQRLQLQPSDVVLEIGFGPGLAISEMSRVLTHGLVYGVDESQVMVKTASQRNRAAIRAGRVKLYCAAMTDLPRFDNAVDKVLTINCFAFWEAPEEALRDLQARMRLGGQVFLVHQVLHKVGEPTIDELAADYRAYLEQAAFADIKVEQDSTLAVICVAGSLSHRPQSDKRSE